MNASCLSTMTSDVAMSHSNVTQLTLPDCAFGLSQRSLIVWSYIGVIYFCFGLHIQMVQTSLKFRYCIYCSKLTIGNVNVD